MPAHDDVLDLQDVNRELQHGQAIQVRVHHDVGNIPVNEQLSGLQPDNLVGGDAAVGTSDPEELRRLLCQE